MFRSSNPPSLLVLVSVLLCIQMYSTFLWIRIIVIIIIIIIGVHNCNVPLNNKGR